VRRLFVQGYFGGGALDGARKIQVVPCVGLVLRPDQ
jgi:hypothetical protein